MNKFKDLNLRFTKNPLTDDVGVVADSNAINQSIKNILFTSAHEIPFQSKETWSDSITSKIFELADSLTAAVIEEEILEKLVRHEPRIIVNFVSVESIDYRVKIIVNYTIRTTESEVVFTTFLERV